MSSGVKIRLQVKLCRDLVKRDLTQRPLPFCRIAIDGASTTVDTKCATKTSASDYVFEQAFDLALGRTDSIIIDVLDRHKLNRKPNKFYLGTLMLTAPLISRYTDAGPSRQTLTNRTHPEVTIKGSIVFELKSRSTKARAAPRLSSTDTPVPAPSSYSQAQEVYFRRDSLHGPPLPRGYEQRTTPQGQVYWLNHETGRSTWHDPRFRNRTSPTGSLPDGWEERRTASGKSYYVDHTKKTTTFTDPRLAASRSIRERPLQEKLKLLRAELAQYFQADTVLSEQAPLRIDIDRADVFESSYSQLLNIPNKYLQRRFVIAFKGEKGIDWGGVTREWFYLLSHRMLDPQYGLFEYTNEETNTLEINSNSSINPEHLSYFKFIGKVIGIAIYHGHYLDGGFTLPFYKKILGIELTMRDLEAVDHDLHASLKWTLDNPIAGVLDDQYFVVNSDVFGQTREEPLCPGGDRIKLNEENKVDYVEHYIKWRLNHGTAEQFTALHRGLDEIVPIKLLRKYFDDKELELVVTGLGKIDINDWQNNTRYRNMTAETELAMWFWAFVNELEEVDRAKLLQFTTGSSRVPISGFAHLRGATSKDQNAIKPFTLVLLVARDPTSLPIAHTCFNRIDIPLYPTQHIFHSKLRQAIDETMGFYVD